MYFPLVRNVFGVFFIFRHLLNIHAYGVSLGNPSLCLYAFSFFFDLSTAPYIFTECVGPLENYWRLKGVKIVICLDNGLVTETDYGVCKTLSSRIKENLR